MVPGMTWKSPSSLRRAMMINPGGGLEESARYAPKGVNRMLRRRESIKALTERMEAEARGARRTL